MEGFATRAIHHGYDPYAGYGSLVPPIVQSSTFTFPTAEDGAARFAGEQGGFIYGRLGNPTTAILESRIANLEGAEACVMTSSGMGAITSLMWSLLKPGDEIITDKTLYGCTFSFFQHGLASMGIKVTHVDLTDPCNLAHAISEQSKVVYFETPANPNMRIVDIDAIAKIARPLGVEIVVDNTYATPYLQQPLALGATVVVHSATKYLGGHGDLLAGAIVGKADLMERVRFFGVKDMTGSVLSPSDANLVLRGLKTLSLRMDRHCSSAMEVAKFLQAHPAVEDVFYPGLKSCEGHEVAARQMKQFGGMIALELKGGYEAGVKFLNALKLFIRAVSLGDAESLAQHPASMTHSTYTPEERAEHGIREGLVRLSVGLEDLPDILADLNQALEATQSLSTS